MTAKLIVHFAAVIIMIMPSGSAFADDYEDGVAAYEEKDYETAFSKFRKAAEQEYASAQYALGHMHRYGEGVPQDAKQGVYWYTKAAEQGNLKAQFSLGVMYGNGYGVPQDAKQAIYWYAKAVEQGNADAQLNLGGMYRYGNGIPKDYVMAYMWLNLAAAKGNASARINLDNLEKEMTREQIAEAQRLAREWKPRKERVKGEAK